ncbi:hypothetical protein [Bartonella birtlesii]|uniref:Lipoprotein n=1 Tax=Bartonella birtlesii LL-WM9 TaxID=1094552 RepID=J0Q317_9HYPH|nr:hypothetical protein [Bartonella birtlesii]EJF76974.1 hypothetical protein ME7_00724 [Bartonella birtlesii LL-WM9]
MYKYLKWGICTVILAISLSACGGRSEKNISVTTLHDGTMSCADIQREFYANKRQINDTMAERHKARNKNVALAAAGVVFLPALFFMDVKSHESNEISALNNRNAVLSDLARIKRCQLPQ